jgi:hypothetical protein
LENIINKLQSFLEEHKIALTDTEETALQVAKTSIENRQQNPSTLDMKEWEKLVGKPYSMFPCQLTIILHFASYNNLSTSNRSTISSA